MHAEAHTSAALVDRADTASTPFGATQLNALRRRPKPSPRQAAIGRAVEVVEQHTSLLLVAPNGFGKTYAAGIVADRIRRTGRTVLRIDATDPDAIESLLAWRTAPAGTAFVVDDGAALGAEHVPAIVEISRSSTYTVLVTLEPARAELEPETARLDAGATRLLTAWRNGSLARIDLPGLDDSEAIAVTALAAGDTVLDDMTTSTIVRLSAGSPRLVHELTKDALETGGSFYVPRSILSLGDSAMSPRLHDLTLPLLDRIDDEGRYSLVMLAKLGPIPYARASRLIGEAPLHTLLLLGLARNDGTALDRIVADELHAWSALSDWRRSWRSRQMGNVQRALIRDLNRGFRLTPNEHFIVGRFWLDAGDADILEAVTAETAAHLFRTAAHVANVAGLPSDGHLLASRSFAFRPSLAAALQQSRALAMLGDLDGAIAAVDVPLNVEASDEDRNELLTWSGSLTKWDARGAIASVGPAVRHVEDPQHERLLTEHVRLVDSWRDASPDKAEVMQTLNELLDDPKATASTRLYAAASLLSKGNPLCNMTETKRVLDRGYAVYRQLSYHALQPLSHSTRDASAMFFLLAGLVRMEAGFPWAELDHDITVFIERAGMARGQLATVDQCVVGILRGTMALIDQDTERAIADLTVVERLLDNTLPPEVHTHVSLSLALGYTRVGQVDEAARRRQAVDGTIVEGSSFLRMIASIVDFAVIANTEGPAAASRFISGIATDPDEAPSARIYAAYLSRRVGGAAAEAASWIRNVPATDLTPLPRALRTYLQAEAAQDATIAEHAARTLETIGARLRAAEAYRLAERLHLAEGRPNQSRRCGEHAERVLAIRGVDAGASRDAEGAAERGPGSDADPEADGRASAGRASSVESEAADAKPAAAQATPTTEVREARSTAAARPSESARITPSPDGDAEIGPDLSGLTRRELEIARLVADGLSNQEIASKLFLSVRTVESHVLQARAKLGAARRRDLGRLVMPPAPPGP
ncbi:helix-turn-helix transcriptional regulator [Plantibacter sp. YIM 135249]|uniref:helix-turn-helix transcriptional regulator n=1 Tax=Plantibacter sp. YIM 135249 TaxID=3423918 RepID=UPI003D34BE11